MLHIEIELGEPEGEVYGYAEDGTELGLLTIYVTEVPRRATWRGAGKLDEEHIEDGIRQAREVVAQLQAKANAGA